jgi:hypothetical protein
MNEPGPGKTPESTAPVPWLGWGLGFAIMFGGLTLTRLLVVKSRVAVAEVMDQNPRPTFELSEIARISVYAFFMGFACGLIAWASRKFTRHLGAFGDVIVGVVVVCALLVMCIVAFDPEVFSRGWFIVLRLFGIATVVGAIAGFWAGKELRRELASTDESPSRTTIADL